MGSHICEHYVKKNWGVIAYDNLTKYELMRTGYNTEGARDYNVNLLKKMGVRVVVADIRDVDSMFKEAKGCDFIIHTAAQPAMTVAIEDPVLDFDVNVMGMLGVLTVAKEYEIPTVSCSTIHVYGNGINERLIEGEDRFYLHGATISEDDPILTGTLTPLHVSKRTAEIYARAYAESYGLRTASFRLTGMYGPRQLGGEDHGWVANFAIRTLLKMPIKVFGTDKQVRDILYVTDAVEAFDLWHQAGCPPGIYNVGGGEKTITSIRKCLEVLRELAGKEQDISILPARKGDLHYFCCNTDMAKRDFGWSPRVMPDEGVEWLVDWIKENKELFVK